MRTLMMLASALVVGVGTFCIANSSASFVSAAFVVGLAILIMGICELIVNRVTVMRSYESTSEVNAEGLMAVIFGIAILAGQVVDNVAVEVVFAFWVTSEGLKTISSSNFDFRSSSRSDNFKMAIGVISGLFGLYMFFDTILFNFSVMMMVGIALILIGINRFRIALAIEYSKPQFLTGNKEKLEEAKRAEKLAMQKAKEAIRETKAAQARIDKLSKEIAREQSMLSGAEKRRRSE